MTVSSQNALKVHALSDRVGEIIGFSRWHDITQPMINAFAATTVDEQFIHMDPVRARAETPYGGTIAHGFLTLSLLSAMAYDVFPFMIDGPGRSINYGFDHLRFVHPVLSGSRVRGRFTLAKFDAQHAEYVELHTDVAMEIDGVEKPALVASWINRQYV